ncbi:MAG TPA: MCE family protein [Solirubrobacteraceae bacterium]|nr:MCE family protein [Solirubrobacteraceae bacterium]
MVIGVIAVVYVLFLSGSDDYTYNARFINASQLVNGDQIEIGGTPVGSISSITLTDNGQAVIAFSLQHKYGPLREGTKAIVRQASLSGVANRYIDLQPGPGIEPGAGQQRHPRHREHDLGRRPRPGLQRLRPQAAQGPLPADPGLRGDLQGPEQGRKRRLDLPQPGPRFVRAPVPGPQQRPGDAEAVHR